MREKVRLDDAPLLHREPTRSWLALRGLAEHRIRISHDVHGYVAEPQLDRGVGRGKGLHALPLGLGTPLALRQLRGRWSSKRFERRARSAQRTAARSAALAHAVLPHELLHDLT